MFVCSFDLALHHFLLPKCHHSHLVTYAQASASSDLLSWNIFHVIITASCWTLYRSACLTVNFSSVLFSSVIVRVTAVSEHIFTPSSSTALKRKVCKVKINHINPLFSEKKKKPKKTKTPFGRKGDLFSSLWQTFFHLIPFFISQFISKSSRPSLRLILSRDLSVILYL